MKHEELIALLKGILKEETVCLTTEREIRIAISDLEEELRIKNNKAAGRGDAAKVAAEIIKAAKKGKVARSFQGAWIGKDGKQYVCEGHVIARFAEPLDLEPVPVGATPFEGERMFKGNFDKVYPLPNIAELKTSLAVTKEEIKREGKKKAQVVYSFGNGYYADPALLLWCLRLTDASELRTEGEICDKGYGVSPMLMEGNGVEVVLLPFSCGMPLPEGVHVL